MGDHAGLAIISSIIAIGPSRGETPPVRLRRPPSPRFAWRRERLASPRLIVSESGGVPLVDGGDGLRWRRRTEHELHERMPDENLLLGGIEGGMLAIAGHPDLVPQ